MRIDGSGGDGLAPAMQFTVPAGPYYKFTSAIAALGLSADTNELLISSETDSAGVPGMILESIDLKDALGMFAEVQVDEARPQDDSMKTLPVVFNAAAIITGLIAAYYWYKASRIAVVPSWGITEPGGAQASQMGWIAGMLDAGKKSADLNKTAALLTAISVLFNSVSGARGRTAHHYHLDDGNILTRIANAKAAIPAISIKIDHR